MYSSPSTESAKKAREIHRHKSHPIVYNIACGQRNARRDEA
jgi:hypothetical protein